MIRHIVLVRPDDAVSHRQVEEVLGELDVLVATLPGMIDFHVGTNVNSLPDLDQGFTHAFTVDFADTAARDAYYQSAGHVSVAEQLAPLLADGLNGLVMFQIEL